MSNAPGLVTPQSQAARLLATEVLLADPEALEDDVLESCLYILRDKLQARQATLSRRLPSAACTT
jgi:hypothetical protein